MLRMVAGSCSSRRSVASRCPSSSWNRCLSANSSSSSSSSKFASEAERLEYLREANRTMQKYELAKQLYKQGKLKSQTPKHNQSSGSSSQRQAHVAQLGIAGLFAVLFLLTPFVGKKIATDEEFKAKYIPNWYDFTVKKPERAWTRDELHEQMVQVQTDLRERAIRGEFTPEKLQEMQQSLQYYHRPHLPQQRDGEQESKIPEGWDRVHPGVDRDENVNEG